MKNKKLTLVALIIAVLSLSIGFAAFSNSLNIKSSANVNPNEDDFGVVFSKEKDSVVDGKVVIASQNTTGNESGVGTIVNNVGAPEISGLSAEFTAPGQQVVYEFYVKNVGSYNAYLTELIFGDGKSFITCTPASGATKDLVDKACEGIKVFVNIENESKVFTSDTLVNKLDNHMISKGASEKVTVTLSYLEGSEVADGDFTVTFGDIGSTYATVKNFTKPVTPISKACTVISGDGTNIGDEIKCGTEEFYVITNDGNNISMLAKYNLNVGGSYDGETITNYANPTGKQSSNMKGVYLQKDDGLCTVANPCEGVLEYSSSSANYDSDRVKKYVDAYRNILVAEGLNDATTSASLITLDTLTEVLSCSLDKGCPITSPWIYSTTYYTRSLNESGNKIYIVHTSNAIFEGGWKIESDPHFFTGVRPVITISTSEI